METYNRTKVQSAEQIKKGIVWLYSIEHRFSDHEVVTFSSITSLRDSHWLLHYLSLHSASWTDSAKVLSPISGRSAQLAEAWRSQCPKSCGPHSRPSCCRLFPIPLGSNHRKDVAVYSSSSKANSKRGKKCSKLLRGTEKRSWNYRPTTDRMFQRRFSLTNSSSPSDSICNPFQKVSHSLMWLAKRSSSLIRKTEKNLCIN